MGGSLVIPSFSLNDDDGLLKCNRMEINCASFWHLLVVVLVCMMMVVEIILEINFIRIFVVHII